MAMEHLNAPVRICVCFGEPYAQKGAWQTMKHQKQFSEPLPILKAIEVARKKFGHHFEKPISPESTYHYWERACKNCAVKMRILYNLDGPVVMFANKTCAFNLSTHTWELYTPAGREHVVCRKLIAFF